MAIEFPDTSISSPDIEKPASFFDIGFFIIAVAASGFSGFTTYLGFSYDLPKIGSFVLALLIGLGLLLINFKIREHKIFGDNLAGPIVALYLFFSVSFISNTNAIYTYFLQNDIVGNTQEEAYRVFDTETGTLINAAQSNVKTQQANTLDTQLLIERKNLQKQITDPKNPGLGERAAKHLVNIERLLGVTLTRLRAPRATAPLSEHIRYAEELDRFIGQQYEPKQGVKGEIGAYLDRVQHLREVYAEEINLQKYDRATTDLMKRDLESLAVDAKTLFGFDESLREINNKADEIGSFQYTWRNFLDLINPTAIILSVLLSIVLDLLTPALSLLLYKRNLGY